MKCILSMAVLVLVFALNAAAIVDGQRQGFVFGGGLGFAPVARWDDGQVYENHHALALQFLAGYGINDKNMIVLELNGTAYSSPRYNSTWLWGTDEILTAQSFEGAAWYHYYGPAGRSFFTTVGAGLFAFDRGERYHSDRGLGYQVGGGFEFFRHFQIGLYVMGGRTWDASDYTHMNVSILLIGVLY
jgi:hypothetical protein